MVIFFSDNESIHSKKKKILHFNLEEIKMSTIVVFSMIAITLSEGFFFEAGLMPFPANVASSGGQSPKPVNFTQQSQPTSTVATSSCLINVPIQNSTTITGTSSAGGIIFPFPATIKTLNNAVSIVNTNSGITLTGSLTIYSDGSFSFTVSGELSTISVDNAYNLSFFILAPALSVIVDTGLYTLTLNNNDPYNVNYVFAPTNGNSEYVSQPFYLDYPLYENLLFSLTFPSGTFVANSAISTVSVSTNDIVQNNPNPMNLSTDSSGGFQYSFNLLPTDIAFTAAAAVDLTISGAVPVHSTDFVSVGLARISGGAAVIDLVQRLAATGTTLAGTTGVYAPDLTLPGDYTYQIATGNGTYLPGAAVQYDLTLAARGAVVGVVRGLLIVDPNGGFSTQGTILLSCLHGSSRITTRRGIKRLDQISPGDRVLTSSGKYAEVKSVVSCWTGPGSSTSGSSGGAPPHDAVIIERGSLGKGIPSHRLIIDPGHLILPPGKKTFIPAGSLVNPDSRIYTRKWDDPDIQKDPSLRYDLILQSPHNDYMANGVYVASRKTLNDAGYSHSYKNLV